MVEQGVARPMRNRLTGWIWLIRKDTGTRTQNAPTMPCTMTKRVYSMPLKKPMKQNRKQVSKQSMA